MKTQVCIIGAGPAGLLLGHLLRAEGVECVVLERRSPDYVLGRIRAGVLENITVSLMERLGLDARLKAEGLPHDGFNLADGERLIRIDIADLTGQAGGGLRPDRTDQRPDGCARGTRAGGDLRSRGRRRCTMSRAMRPTSPITKDGSEHRIDCRFIVGCDGFHGPSRKAIPASRGQGISSANIRSAGSASWPMCRRAITN